MKKLILILIVSLTTFVLHAQDGKIISESIRQEKDLSRADQPFRERYNGVARGNMTFIANNILNRPNTSTPYDGNGYNHQFDLGYIDIDGDPTTFSSSRATLNLPTCSKVVYAGLYWSGIYPFDNWSEENGGVNTRDNDFNEIKFKLPGGNYIDLVADKFDLTKRELIYDDGAYDEMPYVCYKDVTSLVTGLTNANGDYYAANIKATLGIDNQDNDRLGSSAGWSLVIVYENDNESSKKFYVFDGFSTIRRADNPYVDVNVSGFQTIPTGPVRATFLVAALEGDKPIPGDRFQIRNPSGTYTTMTTGSRNPSDNFFNSSITAYNNYLTNRYPDSENTLGFDADLFALNNTSNSILQNNQTNATLRFTTSGDSYYPFLLGMSVEIIEPKIQLVKTIDDGAGNDISGTPVPLGGELWYNVSFQNVGTDNALNTQIVDILPKNVDLIESDLILPAGITASDYTYEPPSLANGFRGVLTINVPDSMVQENGALYDIRFKVKVVESCNEFRDVCSNVIENQAFANYDSDLGGSPRVENEASVAGIDSCNFGVVGTSNFLADTSGCTFERDEVLCGPTITLTAGNGFDSYEWRDSSGTIIGTTQSITVSATGTYTVNKVAPVGCISASETINVIPYNTEPNPLIPFADRMLICPNDGSDLAEIYLCGDGSSRSINLPFDPASSTTVRWFKLDETSCPDETTVGCANLNTGCTWNEVGTAFSQSFTDAGEYRLEVLYDGRCPKTYYFNIFKATLTPDIVTQDIICGNNGQIVVNGVPAGYQYSLSGPSGYFVDFQNSNTFTVTNPGDYSLQIRISNPSAASCTYDFGPINIQSRNIDLDIIPTHMLCAGDTGAIRVQVNNVPGQYTYTLTQGGTTVGTQGPIDSNDYTFNVTTGGTYQVTVTTSSCTITEDVTLNQAPNLTLTAANTKNISCLSGSSDGIITLTANGGTLNAGDQYTFAVWTDRGTDLYTAISDIPASAYFTSNTYSVPNGSEGTYRFVVIDSNNCYTISNPVTITVEPPLTFTQNVTNILCNGDTNGSISVAVNGSNQGYLVEYSLNGGSFNTTGNFTGLATGNYTIDIRASKPSYQCTYTLNATIADVTPLTGTAFLEREFNCKVPAKITFDTTSGGTPSYNYSIGSGFQSDPVFNSVYPGTYNLSIRDANGCIYNLPDPIVVEPAPDEPNVTPSLTYNCDGTANVTLSPVLGSYKYSLDGGPETSTNNFPNLSAGAHTITVFYGKGCEVDVTFNVEPDRDFNGTIVNTTNSVCNGADNGTITISATNFTGGDYEYSIDGGVNWLTAIDNPFRIIGVPVGTHDIVIREGTCVINLGQVTISEPPPMTLTASVTQNTTCSGPVTGATITATATGGTPPYTYSLDGTNWQTSGVFTDIPTGNYIVYLRDSMNCDECGCTVDPFINGSFEDHSFSVTTFRIVDESQVPGWDTTASDNQIEIWRSGFNGVPASNGDYFVELNANVSSSLYQEYCTQPGDVISWSLDHRGRSGVDVAEVRIGGDLGTAAVQQTMSDGTSSWGSYSGTYTVPAGQTTTVIAFNAVSTASGSLSVGNFIDNVNITINKSTCIPVSVTVTPPENIVFTATPTACYTGSNGEIIVSVSQGNGDYQFILNGGSAQTPSPSTATTHTFSGLSAGTYTIDVVDGAGCSGAQQTVTINDQLTGTAATTNVTCNDGSIVVTAQGGDGTYEYAFISTGSGASPVYGASNTFAVSTAGDYDFFIQDGSGCTYSSTVTVGQTIDPSFSTTVSQPNCNGDTGSINVTISGGLSPYTINFNGADTTQAGSTILYDSLAPGTYTIQVTDANGCTQTPVDVVINTLTTVSSTASITQDYTCTTLGEITFTAATGGTAPYTYGVDGVYNSALVYGNLTEGTYVLTVRDNNGCTQSVGSLTIDPLPVIPDFTNSVTYNCDGTGNVTLTPPASPSLTYSYVVDGSPNANNVFNNLSVGSHTITVSAPRACPRDFVVTVAAGQAFGGSVVSSTDVSCNGGTDGSITIEVVNFTGSYDYSLNGGSWITTSNGTETITGLDNISYTIQIRPDASSPAACTISLPSVTIGEPTAVTATAVITKEVTCTAPTGATVEVTGSGGTPGYTYSINGSDFFANSTFTGVLAGTYNIIVRDSNNCDSPPYSLTVNPAESIVFTSTPTACYTGSNGEIVVSVSQGNGDYQFILNGGSAQTPSPS
ncbi:hypothetical protein ACQY1Q_09385, partial [Tenacibaculum sp. TC6]